MGLSVYSVTSVYKGIIYVCFASTNGQTTNFCLHDEQTVKGLRKIALGFDFPFSVLCFHVYVSMLHVSISPCLHVSMSPYLHISMSLCFHVFYPCLDVSLSPCLHGHVSTFLEFLYRKTDWKMALPFFSANKNRNDKLLLVCCKWMETENGHLFSFVSKR